MPFSNTNIKPRVGSYCARCGHSMGRKAPKNGAKGPMRPPKRGSRRHRDETRDHRYRGGQICTGNWRSLGEIAADLMRMLEAKQ